MQMILEKINRTKNYRYYIESEDSSSSSIKTSNNYQELKELKQMLDDELITKEDYDAKKNQLLGL